LQFLDLRDSCYIIQEAKNHLGSVANYATNSQVCFGSFGQAPPSNKISQVSKAINQSSLTPGSQLESRVSGTRVTLLSICATLTDREQSHARTAGHTAYKTYDNKPYTCANTVSAVSDRLLRYQFDSITP